MSEKLNSYADLMDRDDSPRHGDYFNTYDHLPLTESAQAAKNALDNLEYKAIDGETISPKETIVGDSNHIEGQQLSFIKTERGTELTFKLTAEAYNQIHDKLSELPNTQITEFNYFAKSKDGQDDINIPTTEAIFVNANGLSIAIATKSPDWRTVNSVVNIELPELNEQGDRLTNEEIGIRLDDAMTNLLGIEEAFTNPNLDAEQEYKKARYNWHHRIDELKSIKHSTPENLTRTEVFPGYTTITQPGKSKEYQEKYGEFGILHKVADPSVLPKLLTNGLMSTHERFKRGVKTIGISSLLDLKTGGADNVFVRTVTEKSVADKRNDASIYKNDIILAIKPDITDRTDWYAYDDDMKGSTDPEVFNSRLTPDQLFKHLNNTGYKELCTNEQMYRTGIAVESIAGIAVPDIAAKRSVVLMLQNQGVEEVNNILVEDFVHVADKVSQIIDISNGRPPRREDEYYNRSAQGWTELDSLLEYQLSTTSPERLHIPLNEEDLEYLETNEQQKALIK